MGSRRTRPTRTVNPDLARGVKAATSSVLPASVRLAVVSGRIKADKLDNLLRVISRRYDERACTTGIPFDRASLEALGRASQTHSVQVSDLEYVTIVRLSEGWDFCVQIVGPYVEAELLGRALQSAENEVNATSVSVVSPNR